MSRTALNSKRWKKKKFKGASGNVLVCQGVVKLTEGGGRYLTLFNWVPLMSFSGNVLLQNTSWLARMHLKVSRSAFFFKHKQRFEHSIGHNYSKQIKAYWKWKDGLCLLKETATIVYFGTFQPEHHDFRAANISHCYGAAFKRFLKDNSHISSTTIQFTITRGIIPRSGIQHHISTMTLLKT